MDCQGALVPNRDEPFPHVLVAEQIAFPPLRFNVILDGFRHGFEEIISSKFVGERMSRTCN